MRKQIFEIEINNLRKYQTRTDIKTMNYFRVSSRIFEDPEFYSLSSSAKLLWLFILSLGATKNCARVKLNPSHTAVMTGLTPRWIVPSLEALEQLQWVTILSRDANVPKVKESKVKQSKVKERKVVDEPLALIPPEKDPPSKTHWLVELWNKYRGKLPAARVPVSASRLKTIQARVKQEPDKLNWEECIRRMSESHFCNGLNDRAWVADFGFLIKPDTINKVLEGKYDNRTPIKNITNNPHLLIQEDEVNDFNFNQGAEL